MVDYGAFFIFSNLDRRVINAGILVSIGSILVYYFAETTLLYFSVGF